MAAPTRVLALLVALPLVLSACGQAAKDSASDFQGDQKSVAQTVEDLQSASRKNDSSRICTSLLAPALVAQVKKASDGDCEKGDRKSTRLNSSHPSKSRMPSSA